MHEKWVSKASRKVGVQSFVPQSFGKASFEKWVSKSSNLRIFGRPKLRKSSNLRNLRVERPDCLEAGIHIGRRKCRTEKQAGGARPYRQLSFNFEKVVQPEPNMLAVLAGWPQSSIANKPESEIRTRSVDRWQRFNLQRLRPMRPAREPPRRPPVSRCARFHQPPLATGTAAARDQGCHPRASGAR